MSESTHILDWLKSNWEWLLTALGLGGSGIIGGKMSQKNKQEKRDKSQDEKIETLQFSLLDLKTNQAVMSERLNNLDKNYSDLKEDTGTIIKLLMQSKVK